MAARTVAKRARAAPARAGYHHGDLPRALVSAAVELIRRDGPDAISLREVARAVGVNHTAAYRHFEDKSALLAAVAEQGFEALATRMEAALAGLPTRATGAPKGGSLAAEGLRALGATYLAFALESPAHYRVMFGPRLNESGRFPSLEAVISRAVAPLVEVVRGGIDRGELGPGRPLDLGMSFWTLTHGYASLVLARRIRVKSPSAAAEYFDTVLRPLIDGLARR